MRVINISLNELETKVLMIGFEGENQITQVRIDAAEILTDYPNATPTLIVKPLFGFAYPVIVTQEGTDVVWEIDNSVLSFHGDGEIQLTFTETPVIAKSYVGRIRIKRSLAVNGEAPDPIERWEQAATAKLAEVDAQIDELEDMVEAAEAAKDQAQGIVDDAAADIQAAGAAQVQVVQAAGEEVLDSIPSDYTELSDDVTGLKSAFGYLISETEVKYIPKGATAEGTQLTLGGYIDLNGAYQSSASYSSSDYIEIPAILTIDPYCYGMASILNIAFYNASKQYITDSGVGASSSWGRVSGSVTIPKNAKYYRLCLMVADTTGRITVKSAERYSTQEVEEVSKRLEESYKIMVSDITGGDSGYVDGNGEYNSTASWIVTSFISVKEITEMKEHVAAYTTVPYAVYYDQYKVFIGHETASSQGLDNKTLNIPDDAYYVRLNMLVADTTQYYEYTVDNLKLAAIAIKNATDGMYGKKIGAVGDSITIGTYSVPGMTYVNQIANAHNMTVDNQAIWGSVFPTGKTQAGQPQGSIYSQIASVSADCDMLIICGGINDADYQADESYWGAVSGGYSATLDTTTFCGAFEGTLKSALDKFKGKPILFVFEHRMTTKYQSQYGVHFEDVQYPLMIEMLNKWGIPYVDLFHDMPSIKLTPGYIELYSFDDQGIHPNIAGYRKFYVPRVESGLQEIAK